MAKKEGESVAFRCPVARLLDELTDQCERARASQFGQHLRNAKVEVLLAIRSLIDDRVEQLREKPKPKPKGRTQKIQVKSKD